MANEKEVRGIHFPSPAVQDAAVVFKLPIVPVVAIIFIVVQIVIVVAVVTVSVLSYLGISL